MADDVLLNKAAIIERCLARIAQEYEGHESEMETSLTRQDAIVLNLQRACEAAIDGAMHLVRIHRLGLPQDSREAFTLIEDAGILPTELAATLRSMVGFRNIATHDYRKLSLAILRSILAEHLGDLRSFVALLVSRAM